MPVAFAEVNQSVNDGTLIVGHLAAEVTVVPLWIINDEDTSLLQLRPQHLFANKLLNGSHDTFMLSLHAMLRLFARLAV